MGSATDGTSAIDAVRELRSRLEREQSKSRSPLLALSNRLERCHSELAATVRRGIDEGERAVLVALLTDAISRFEESMRSIAAIGYES